MMGHNLQIIHTSPSPCWSRSPRFRSLFTLLAQLQSLIGGSVFSFLLVHLCLLFLCHLGHDSSLCLGLFHDVIHTSDWICDLWWIFRWSLRQGCRSYLLPLWHVYPLSLGSPSRVCLCGELFHLCLADYIHLLFLDRGRGIAGVTEPLNPLC